MRINNWILCLGVVVLEILIMPGHAAAFIPDTDCVIQDFNSQIQLHLDASAKIDETLLVDCGTLPNKHGIFRILPTKINWGRGIYPYTPIKLLSITNSQNLPYNHSTINDRFNHTLTWKIGNPDVTITGLNIYKISYLINNVVIPSTNGNALYLNLNGNFWELPINKYTATINLPAGITSTNTTTQLYSGIFGNPGNNIAKLTWLGDGKGLLVSATNLPPQTGVTIWAEFPAGIVTLFHPSWLALYGQYLWGLLLLISLWFGANIWRRFGQDLRFRGSVMVEYDPPKGLSPLTSGLLTTYGTIKPIFVSATIVDLAVRGYLTIKEITTSGWPHSKDWEIALLNSDIASLKPFEQKLLVGLFGNNLAVNSTTTISAQKDNFYTQIPLIRGEAYQDIKQLFDSRGVVWQIIFFILGFGFLLVSIPVAIVLFSFFAGTMIGLSGISLIIFAILMPKRTPAGRDMLYQLLGFKLYMKQAETYRMRFYEQEGMFEKYLSYAIVFGLTHLWAKAFVKISAEKHQPAYIPAWYVMTAGSNFSAGNLDTFANNLSSLSLVMASTLSSSPSSSGSGGFSGGGGGGGGGGSW